MPAQRRRRPKLASLPLLGLAAALLALPGLGGHALAAPNQDTNRLYEDLMMSYNRFVRPVQNDTDTLVVKLGLKLSQLIDVVSGSEPKRTLLA